MKVLVLGHNGMLGNAVFKYLTQKGLELVTTKHRWPSAEFKEIVSTSDVQVVVNCIGAIPQRKKIFNVNYELPKWLDENAKCKIIHPGTDCEIDDDEYGVSKRQAVNYIIEKGKNTKIIKTSIIGHEVNSKASLLDWFLNEEGSVRGYNNHYWNGNTTLQWAKVCFEIINSWDKYDTLTIIESERISKFELLNIISNVYEKDIIIEDYTHPKTVNNKCLKGNIIAPSLSKQLSELKGFYKK